MQVSRGLSVHAWPSGHAIDSEEAIQFTELEGINCMVQTFPLEKANEAYGRIISIVIRDELFLFKVANQLLDAMIQGTVRFRAVITMN
jgi:D-arabinose 1-dehydrogenase-like Zn-dependent alcohol dehydrogenase